ncbi:MAG TPA: hypothetical protein VLD63_08500 [Anaerolineales bacterium]|nr:hypothetical protein [Anaerolineales bacterium]
MSTRVEEYRQKLRTSKDVEGFLRSHSGLPGPRGNLELAHAFALEGSLADIRRFASLDAEAAPENTPGVFLAFCGILGLSRMVIRGDRDAEASLRRRASDSRWRVREAVATSLQLVGDEDRRSFARIVTSLARGTPLEQRAAVAAVAEPRLLSDTASVGAGLKLLDRVTASLARASRPLGEAEMILRQALAYAWSVVVAADPAKGKQIMEGWLTSDDPDVQWLMRQNLSKKRLQKMDSAWCARWAKRLAVKSGSGARTKTGRKPSGLQ